MLATRSMMTDNMHTRYANWLQKFISNGTIIVHPNRPIVVGPSYSPDIIVGPKSPVLVEPSQSIRIQPPARGAWQEKGWAIQHNTGQDIYRGYYIVKDWNSNQSRSYPGRIDVSRRNIQSFIANPPAAIRSHPKGACFSLISEGWFQIHWHRSPHNVDDAILYIERILDEVLNRRIL